MLHGALDSDRRRECDPPQRINGDLRLAVFGDYTSQWKEQVEPTPAQQPMTSDEFNSHYKLLKQMALKEGRSYTAEHLPSGRAVLVHILDEAQFGGASRLSALIERLPPRERSRVLETVTVDHSLVVITQFLPAFEGFERWLRASTSDPAPPPAAAPGPSPEMHGDFTRLFRSAEDNPAPPPDRGPIVNEELSPAPPGGSKFTDLFRAPARPPSSAPDPNSATIPPVRMVGVRLPPLSEPAPAQQGPPRLMPNIQTPSEPPTPPPAPPRLVPHLEGTGSPPPEPDLAGWPRPDEVVIRAGEPPAAPLPPPSWKGPSEYTRLFGSVPEPSGELAQVADVAEPHEEAPERKRSYLPLFLVLNVVFILATGLVVYFALRRC
jgi:hypothetical protein